MPLIPPQTRLAAIAERQRQRPRMVLDLLAITAPFAAALITALAAL